MTDNVNPEIRRLPLWQAAQREGQDIGLRIALDVVVAAGVDEEQRANRTSPPVPANAHAASVLRKVADQIAARFRQTTR
jgi:hypothetical protein